MTGNEFKLIDDGRVPLVIKPMVILHDDLVNGFNNQKDIRIPQLIRRIEKNLTLQVEELVNLEDEHNYITTKLVSSLEVIRKAIDKKPKDVSKYLIKYLDKEIIKLEDKYGRDR